MKEEKKLTMEQVMRLIAPYEFEGELDRVSPLGNGHINDTYLLEFSNMNSNQFTWVLQRVNTHVFREPEKLMENMERITQWISNRLQDAGEDPRRRVLEILKTKENRSFVEDERGNTWRITHFVEDALCYERASDTKVAFECAYAFGRFQRLLHGFPVERLHETIEGFHDTRKRFQRCMEAIRQDTCGRVCQVQEEIAFILERKHLAEAYEVEHASHPIPVRVTHNDTKINNVMLDAATGKGLCVLDLDTVMPGYIMNDFGDIVRTGANRAMEAEADLSKVSLDMEIYEALAKGFVQGCGEILTEQEKRLLPLGAKVMIYELILRFLTDYLEGDTYFKIAFPEHNLVRTRNQMQLLLDVERNFQKMQECMQQL